MVGEKLGFMCGKLSQEQRLSVDVHRKMLQTQNRNVIHARWWRQSRGRGRGWCRGWGQSHEQRLGPTDPEQESGLSSRPGSLKDGTVS